MHFSAGAPQGPLSHPKQPPPSPIPPLLRVGGGWGGRGLPHHPRPAPPSSPLFRPGPRKMHNFLVRRRFFAYFWGAVCAAMLQQRLRGLMDRTPPSDLVFLHRKHLGGNVGSIPTAGNLRPLCAKLFEQGPRTQAAKTKAHATSSARCVCASLCDVEPRFRPQRLQNLIFESVVFIGGHAFSASQLKGSCGQVARWPNG